MYIRWKIPANMYKYIMHKITYAYFQCRYNIIFIVFCPYIIGVSHQTIRNTEETFYGLTRVQSRRRRKV